jgi:hypothetical protein
MGFPALFDHSARFFKMLSVFHVVFAETQPNVFIWIIHMSLFLTDSILIFPVFRRLSSNFLIAVVRVMYAALPTAPATSQFVGISAKKEWGTLFL